MSFLSKLFKGKVNKSAELKAKDVETEKYITDFLGCPFTIYKSTEGSKYCGNVT